MNNPPDPHSARFAKVAWPIVSEREGLPRPPADYVIEATQPDPPARGDILAILLGLSAGVWTLVVLAVIKFWPAISAAFARWL